jgi:hypothetical protein
MTPQDLKQIGNLIKENLDVGLKSIKSDIVVLKDQNNRTEKHLQSIEDHLIEWKSELFNIVDGLAGETRDQREFRTINGHQTSSNTRRIEELEVKTFGAVSSL